MKIALDQWQIFKTIVDEGSFSAAAEALNKSQSSVSYAMQQMAEHLATPVFEQRGRKAVLTEAGRTLYRHADNLLKQAQAMENLARDMAQGIESEIALAADALTPQEPLFEGLQSFSEHCPRTRVKVYETTLSGTDEALLSGRVQIALMPHVPPGFLGDIIAKVHMIPVVASSHRLARRNAERAISETELKQERQIIIRDSGLKREQNAGWLGAEQRWTFSHFATSINAVKAGLGFAFLPSHKVASALATGELHQLQLQGGGQRHLTLYLVQATPGFAGPAATHAAKTLKTAFTNYM
ncbi:MAG TPA: LysR family transcriptional regulator [Marinagarivorans sp.]